MSSCEKRSVHADDSHESAVPPPYIIHGPWQLAFHETRGSIEEQRVKDTDRLPDGTTLDSAVQCSAACRGRQAGGVGGEGARKPGSCRLIPPSTLHTGRLVSRLRPSRCWRCYPYSCWANGWLPKLFSEQPTRLVSHDTVARCWHSSTPGPTPRQPRWTSQ